MKRILLSTTSHHAIMAGSGDYSPVGWMIGSQVSAMAEAAQKERLS